VLEWKWEEIVIDFIVGLPRTQLDYDSMWMIVDPLIKVAHFIPVKITYSGPQLVELCMSRIVCLHRVSKKIVSDRGTQFTSKFWERLHETLDTQLRFSSAYHPQTDDQTERVNQILEDMLRACVLQYGRSWDKSLCLAICLCVPEEKLPMDNLGAKDLSYQEYPVKILETSERVTRNKKIRMCKSQWSHHTEEEATWEREEELKVEYPSFFFDPSKSRGRDSF
jgi:transposase InsO family protein